MRHSCFSKIFLLILMVFGFSVGKEMPKSVCIYYHHNPPEEIFYLCDWVVLDRDTPYFDKKNAKVFGYVSLEEGEKYRDYYKDLKDSWKLGKNRFWKTDILDIRNKEYRDFLLKKVFSKMKRFDGFFLDTLDSYKLVLNKKDWKSYEEALVTFIKGLKQKFPEKKIIINRGFEIVDQIKDKIDGFAVESLFRGINVENKGRYIKIDKKEREYLIQKLKKIKKYGIPVIVIDYLPPKERKKALQLSKKIQSLGFIPWITDKEVSSFGTSTFQFVPRKILLVYDSFVCEDVVYCNVHRLASLIVEYLGFVPVLKDVSDLPEGYTVDRYAGIIVWVQRDVVSNYQKFYSWIISKIKEGNRILFLESFGFPKEKHLLESLGIKTEKNRSNSVKPADIIYRSDIFGFEADPVIQLGSVILKPAKGKPLLKVKNEKGQISVPAAITEWGGYLVDGTVLRQDIDDLWAADPFRLFKTALRLPDIPAPDITTENGNRTLFVHIDGDSFMGKAEWDRDKFASEVIRDQIIKVFKIPHTVSVIEGEIAPWGLYPNISERLESIARSIFSLENVEAGSHTFSHPLKWKKLFKGENKKGYNLPIKNYRFSIEREIKGSVDYINSRLMPEGKKVKVFQWSGDCLPPWQAVKMTYDLGLLNINGGDTTATDLNPYLSHVSPMGVDRNSYFQVYAAIQNENIFTNDWTGPFYGYIKVLQTFKLTENPRRLKPINIYYHFYSGSKLSSLNALKKVYKWALSQKTTPIFSSQWIKKVLDFRKMAFAYDGKGYIIRSGGKLRTLRINSLYPDLEKSKGIIGYKKEKGRIYIHLDNSGDYYLVLTEKEKKSPHIVDFNGIFKRYEDKKMILKSYVKPVLNLYLPENCTFSTENFENVRKKGRFHTVIYKNPGDIKIEWKCR